MSLTQPDETIYSFLRDFTMAGATGAIAKTVTAPLERVSLLLQTQKANPKIISGEIPRFTGITNCFSRVAAEQGYLSFWRGNLVNIIRFYPTMGFNMAFKDVIKQAFPRYSPSTDFGKFFMVQMASGTLAGAASLSLVYPLEYARTRLATDVGKERAFKGLTDCLVKTVRGPMGIRGLYIGFGISMSLIVPSRMLYFGFYDSFREFNPLKDDTGIMGIVSRFAIAQTTVMASDYLIYPYDTVRRRLQLQAERPKSEWIYKGNIDCFKQIFKNEGFTSFYGGGATGIAKRVGSALVLVLYDQIRETYFEDDNAHDSN